MRPLLLLDVDGVLSPLGTASPPRGFERENIDGFHVTWSQEHAERFTDLVHWFDPVWATTWEHKANLAIAPRLRLPQLPVIEFSKVRRGDTWKLADVRNYVGERAVAWVDDELYFDAYRWADERSPPTLLIKPMSSLGLTEAHFVELEAFGRSLVNRV